MKEKIKCPNCNEALPDCDSDGVLKCDSCDWGCTKELWDYNMGLIKRVLVVLKSQKFKDIKKKSVIIYNKEIVSA